MRNEDICRNEGINNNRDLHSTDDIAIFSEHMTDYLLRHADKFNYSGIVLHGHDNSDLLLELKRTMLGMLRSKGESHQVVVEQLDLEKRDTIHYLRIDVGYFYNLNGKY